MGNYDEWMVSKGPGNVKCSQVKSLINLQSISELTNDYEIQI